MKRALLLCLGIVFGLGLAAPSADQYAVAKDRTYEEVWKEYTAEKGDYPFKDLSHIVEKDDLEDSRWTALHWDKMQVEEGTQLFMNWSRSRSENPWDIQVRVNKVLHSKDNGGTRTTFSMPFDHIGKSIKTSRDSDMAEAYYEDWKKSASDVIEKECKEPKKKKLGKIKGLYGYATGTDKETGNRERRAWFVWRTPNVTWVATVRYQASVLSSEELIEKGEDFLKSIQELDEDWEGK